MSAFEQWPQQHREAVIYRFGVVMCALMLLSCVVAARGDEPPIKLIPKPEPIKLIEFRAQPGMPIKLSAANGAKWALVGDSGDAEIFPCPMGETCSFVAPRAGQYFLTVHAGETTHRIVVIVQADKPPEPMPPPKPPEPKPVDPLLKQLQAAFDADTRQPARKIADILDLIELYGQAVKLANSPDVATFAALISQIQAASRALGIVGLVEVRRAIAAELAILAGQDAPLTADARAKAASVFLRIQTALKGVTRE